MKRKMVDKELVEVLSLATREIMERTGDPFEVAVKKAKIGLKEYIRLRVETMRDLVNQGYSEEAAFKEAKRMVNVGVACK